MGLSDVVPVVVELLERGHKEGRYVHSYSRLWTSLIIFVARQVSSAGTEVIMVAY